MRRRRFLGTVGAGLLVGAAGCVAGGDGVGDTAGGDGNPTAERTETATATAATDAQSGPAETGEDIPPPGALRDPDLPLDRSDLVRAAAPDAIPAIDDPAFGEDWSSVTATLGDRDRVIGVTIDGQARAYPLAVLNWHEVVNDSVEPRSAKGRTESVGIPLLVTYCPLCRSGVTADRTVDGRETDFGVSGYLWYRDLVLYDHRTGSLWSQILGTAVRGPQTGETLSLRPSTLTTWGEWRDEYPDTSVLLPPPESGTVSPNGVRNYNINPYGDSRNRGVPGDGSGESGDFPFQKSLVIGIAAGNTARAYPRKTVIEAGGVVNDTVGDLPVVVANTRDSLVAYVRRVDGEALEFGREDGTLLAVGSRWGLVSGRALDGPFAGATLERANDRSPMFWFAWDDFVPDSDVYERSA